MSEYAISLKNVGKSFRVPLDRSTTLKYRFTHPRSTSRFRELRAINDISFDVPHGEFLGITGPNGCGKSTLLKVLSRIYEPDDGTMVVDGQVSPFLELGVGFNHELTARENIFLGGAVLGLTRSELRTKVDSILDFADLTDFADQKLKNFSSGMQVRLAFTVAIQADAGILLMDEVLAVGDASFQEKCFDVFARYKREGRTIVLVTHDLNALTTYCDRVLLLSDGRLIADGPAAKVTAEYRRRVGEHSEAADAKAAAISGSPEPSHRWGSRDVEITAVRMLNALGEPHSSFTTGEAINVEVDYLSNRQVEALVCGLAFRRTDGLTLFGTNTHIDKFTIPGPAPGSTGTIRYEVDDARMLAGAYALTAALYDMHGVHAFDHQEDVVPFRMVDEHGRVGLIDLSGNWSVDSAARAEGDAAAPSTPAATVGGQERDGAGPDIA